VQVAGGDTERFHGRKNFVGLLPTAGLSFHKWAAVVN
jgi:hypothetical protein